MTLTVFYKSGFERTYENVVSINTQITYVKDVPVYQIRFWMHGESITHGLHNVKSFEIFNRKLCWIKTNKGFKCPKCNIITNPVTGREYETIYCPYCGNDNS